MAIRRGRGRRDPTHAGKRNWGRYDSGLRRDFKVETRRKTRRAVADARSKSGNRRLGSEHTFKTAFGDKLGVVARRDSPATVADARAGRRNGTDPLARWGRQFG